VPRNEKGDPETLKNPRCGNPIALKNTLPSRYMPSPDPAVTVEYWLKETSSFGPSIYYTLSGFLPGFEHKFPNCPWLDVREFVVQRVRRA
jgi:hypothetical protein